MENGNNPISRNGGFNTSAGIETQSLAKNFVSNVMVYMTAALAISGVIAYWVGSNMDLLRLLYNAEGTGLSIFGWVAKLGTHG